MSLVEKNLLTMLDHLSSSWNFSGKNLKIPKGVIRIHISKKNKQHNGQKKKDKRTNSDLQNIHIKLKIE